jgi:hypothetical protein
MVPVFMNNIMYFEEVRFFVGCEIGRTEDFVLERRKLRRQLGQGRISCKSICWQFQEQGK